MDRIRWWFRAWRYRLRLDPREVRVLLAHLQPGDTAIDVGAHKGGYTWWMRRGVGASGRVFAFEPQPGLAGHLRNLVASTGFDNVLVENLGLSSRTGTLELNIPGPGTSPGASFEKPGGQAPAGHVISVPVTTLDAWLATRAPGRVSLLKCDAEGHELEVFRGAEGLLREQGPLLLFECERRHRSSGRVDDVFAFLEGLGYRGQAFARAGLIDLDAFDPARHQASPDQPDYVNNFLFRADPALRGASGC